jgi:alpha-acetolactate decarboxylase
VTCIVFITSIRNAIIVNLLFIPLLHLDDGQSMTALPVRSGSRELFSEKLKVPSPPCFLNTITKMTDEELKPNHIFQYSLLNALMAGVAESGIATSTVCSKGNIGLGTFQRIHGELIILDSTAYRLNDDGHTSKVDPNEELPYALVTNFVPQTTSELSEMTREALGEQLEKESSNHFLIFQVDAYFEHISCRTVRGQKYKGQPLSELSKAESRHKYEDIKGTIIGIYSPALWQGIGVGGEHMHFMDNDRKIGGHVLDFKARDVKLSQSTSSDFHIQLPAPGTAFDEADLTTDAEALKSAESNRNV